MGDRWKIGSSNETHDLFESCRKLEMMFIKNNSPICEIWNLVSELVIYIIHG